MSNPNAMATVTEVLNKLIDRGIANEFKVINGGLTVDGEKIYDPSELEIVKVFRFEGVSDPADMSVIYIIKASNGLIGYSMNAYGTYNDNELDYDNIMRQIPERGRDEQMQFEL